MNEFIARNGIIAQNNSTISGSLTVTAGITGSIFGSSSYAATSSYADNFTVAGTLTAQTLVVQTITSSIVYSSGSNVFGNSLSNTQVFTGSLYQTGSVAAFMGNVGIGTASPEAKLDVSGSIKILYPTGKLYASATSLFYGEIIPFNASGQMIFNVNYSEGNIIFQSGSVEVARFKNTNLGIGTNSPAQKLEVNGGDALIRTAYIGNISAFGTNYASFSHIARTGSGDYSFISANDGTTYINAKTSSPIRFRIDNTDKVIINSLGLVGINTTSPSYALDVIGQAAIGSGAQAIVGTDGTYAGYSTIGFGGTTNGYNRVFGHNATSDGLYLAAATGKGIDFWTNGVYSRMFITSGGNIGIGTNNPNGKLTVKETDTNWELNTTADKVQQLAYNRTTSAYKIMEFRGSAFTFNPSDVEKVRINGDGDLLVGTATSIWASSGRGIAQVNGSSTSLIGLSIGDQAKAYLYHNGGDLALYTYTGNINFQNSNGSVLSVSGTNVGIGTTSPSYALDVVGDARARGFIVEGGGAYASGSIYSDGNWGMIFRARQASPTAAQFMWATAGDTELMRISPAGNVGIGTTSPSARLHTYLADGANDNTLRIQQGTNAYAAGLNIVAANDAGAGYNFVTSNTNGGTEHWRITGGAAANTLALWTKGVEKARITPSGSFLVGDTIAPDQAYWKGTAIFGNNGENKVIVGQLRNSTITGAMVGGHNSALDAWADLNLMGGSVYIGAAQSIYLTVKNDGNVGIGITNPSAKFHVLAGYDSTSMILDHGSSAYRTYFGFDGTGNYIETNGGTTATQKLRLQVYNNSTTVYTQLYIDGGNNVIYTSATANVGIGITNPSAKLSVAGNIYAEGYNNHITLKATSGTFSYLELTDSTSNGYLIKNTSSSTANGALAGALYTYTDNSKAFQHIYAGTPLFTILSGGNVGINTTNPGYKLQVQGTVYINETLYVNQATTIEDTFTVKTATGAYDVAVIDYSGAAGGRIKVYTDGILRSQIGSYYGDNTFFNAGYGGNVGIGLTSPASLLHVGPATNFTITGRTSTVYTGSDSETIFTIGRSGTDYPQLLDFGVNQSGLYSTISARRFTTDENKLILQPNGGNVGIGSTAPTQGKLVVNGGVYATSFTGSFSGTIAGYLPLAGGTMTGTLQMSNQILAFDQSGTRSWSIAASGGELNFTSGDGAGVYDFDNIVYSSVAVQAPSYYSNYVISRAKLRLWGTDTNYAIGFTNGVTFGGLNDYAITTQVNNDPTRGFWWGHEGQALSQGAMALTTDGNLTVAARIRVGYGASDTTTPSTYAIQASGDVDITGTLTAAVKSFVIDHPTKADKKLQYGVLEGPEHSVYIRGRLKNTKYITLPDYWHALVHEDSITVNITAIGRNQDIWVEQVNEHEITVGYEGNTVEYFYTVFAERKDIDKLITEFDKEV